MKDRVKSILRRSGLSSPSLIQEQIHPGSRVYSQISNHKPLSVQEAAAAREATRVLAWKVLADRLCPDVYTDPRRCHAAASFRALLGGKTRFKSSNQGMLCEGVARTVAKIGGMVQTPQLRRELDLVAMIPGRWSKLLWQNSWTYLVCSVSSEMTYAESFIKPGPSLVELNAWMVQMDSVTHRDHR